MNKTMNKTEAKKLMKRIEELRGDLQTALEELKEGVDEKIAGHTDAWLDGEHGSAWGEFHDSLDEKLDEVESMAELSEMVKAL